jgi:hypothetical protein
VWPDLFIQADAASRRGCSASIGITCRCREAAGIVPSRYEVDLDLSKGTIRCNCSICKKARSSFAFVGGSDLREYSQAKMGGKFYALAVSTLDDVDTDELAAAPLKFIDNLYDRFDRAPEDTGLL